MANTDVSKEIANNFKKFIHEQGYDPYEVAMLCRQVLEENQMKYYGHRLVIGVRLFDEHE